MTNNFEEVEIEQREAKPWMRDGEWTPVNVPS